MMNLCTEGFILFDTHPSRVSSYGHRMWERKGALTGSSYRILACCHIHLVERWWPDGSCVFPHLRLTVVAAPWKEHHINVLYRWSGSDWCLKSHLWRSRHCYKKVNNRRVHCLGCSSLINGMENVQIQDRSTRLASSNYWGVYRTTLPKFTMNSNYGNNLPWEDHPHHRHVTVCPPAR